MDVVGDLIAKLGWFEDVDVRSERQDVGNYVPPVLEALGLAEVEHNARNNRMRAT